jgi:hypothetical protein
MNSRPDRPARRRVLAMIVAALLVVPTAPETVAKEAASAGLQPFKVRYQATYRGISGGQIENSLRPGDRPGHWIYETRAFPNLLGRVAVSPQARERGTMEVTSTGVRPLSFQFDDGKPDLAKDVRFAFDWGAGRVAGVAQGEPFDLAVAPGTQDTASVQTAMIVELLAGREPKGFTILMGSRLREYRYWSEGRATVVTPLGQFDTVVWVNQREGSDRLVKVWHAPSLGFMPVQAVQFRKGQLETQLKLVSFERP